MTRFERFVSLIRRYDKTLDMTDKEIELLMIDTVKTAEIITIFGIPLSENERELVWKAMAYITILEEVTP